MCERNIDRLPLTHAPDRNQACNTSICADWELNPQPFLCGTMTNQVIPVRDLGLIFVMIFSQLYLSS